METYKNFSQLPASRFPEGAEFYFCDNCGQDLTKNFYRDRSSVWQPLRPIWFKCACGRKYLSGAAEWDDLSTWEQHQRTRQLSIGFVLLAVLVIPVTLAYFALRYGGVALLAVVAIALIPSILVAKPLAYVVLDLYEIVTSIWRTRLAGRRSAAAPAPTPRLNSSYLPQLRLPNLRWPKFRLTHVAAVFAILIIGSRWIPSHLDPASPVSASFTPVASDAAPAATLPAPVKPSRSPLPQVAVTGAPNSAFRRVQVGANEVDYVTDDVTIRHFKPTSPRARIQLASNEVRMGRDVTIRYFGAKPNLPRTRP